MEKKEKKEKKGTDLFFSGEGERKKISKRLTNVLKQENKSVPFSPFPFSLFHRFIAIGNLCKNRLLIIVHTVRGIKIRIISARKATKKERKQYEENAKRSRHA